MEVIIVKEKNNNLKFNNSVVKHIYKKDRKAKKLNDKKTNRNIHRQIYNGDNNNYKNMNYTGMFKDNMDNRSKNEFITNLYIDGNNITRTFFSYQDYWNFYKGKNEVKKFINNCRNSYYEPIFIFDGIRLTSETINKWKSRRKENTIKMNCTNLPFSNFMLYEVLLMLNVNCFFSLEADCDHTLASYANYNYGMSNKSIILSKDRDYYRYIDRNFEIVTDFKYKNNQIFFYNASLHKKRKDGVSQLEIIYPPPKVTTDWLEILTKYENGVYYHQRSSPTNLTRYFDNPNIHLKDLRNSVFLYLGIPEGSIIEELFPSWNFKYNEFKWHIEKYELKYDQKSNNLLNECDVLKIISLFFPEIDVRDDIFYNKYSEIIDNKSWSNHVFAVVSSILFLYSIISGIPLIELMNDFNNDYNNYNNYNNYNINY